MSYYGHTASMLEGSISEAFREKLLQQEDSPYPYLGRIYLPAELLSRDMYKFHGSGDGRPEPVAAFLISSFFGLPDYTPEGGFSAEHKANIRRVDRQIGIDQDELEAIGCKSVSSYCTTKELSDGRKTSPGILYVPYRSIDRIPYGAARGRLRAWSNRYDLAKFYNFLVKKNYIDPANPEHEEMIKNTFEDRVLHLAQQHEATAKAPQPHLLT